MTIREEIDKYRNRLSSDIELSPVEATQIIVELTAFLGNIILEEHRTKAEYLKKKWECLEEVKSVARAVVKAETSEEYRNYEMAKGYKEMTVEMIRGLKIYVRSQGDEYGFNK